MLFNINRGKQDPKAPGDFMYKHAEQKRRDSSLSILQTMRALAEKESK
mgnify:FL=1